jgi:N-methylhydantoinase A
MRYHGQSFEIEVPLEESWIESGDIEKMARAFHDQHEQIYGYCDRKAPVQFINIRLVVAGPSPKPSLAKIPDAKGPLKPVAVNKVYYDSCQHTVPFYQRAELGAGRTFEGPAVILQDDCTTCVLDRFRGFVDPLGIIHLEHLG